MNIARLVPHRGLARLAGGCRRLLWGWGTVLLALALIAVAGTVWRIRAIELDEAQRETASLAFALAEQTTRSLQAIDIVLRDITEQMQTNAAVTDSPVKVLGVESVHDLLRERLQQLPQARGLALVDASGKLLNTARRWPVPDLDLSDRDYYNYFLANDSREAFVSAPVHNRVSGAWTIFLARRINAHDGRLLGVAIAGVEISYLEEIFNSINLPRQLMFVLLRRDGTILARHPGRRLPIGGKLPAASPWYGVVAAGGGNFVASGFFGGKRRMISSRPLREYPLVLDVSVAEEEVLGPWRRDALLVSLAAALVIGLAVFLLHNNRRRLRQVQESETSLKRRAEELAQLSARLRLSEARLSQKSRQLETTLTSMDQGLILIDAEGRIALCNERARLLLNVPAELMAACPPFGDLLDYQWRVNRTGKSEETFEEFTRARTQFTKPHAHELRRPDGRVIEVRSVPLAEGGAVRTYTDITERKACEDRSLYFAQHDDLTRLPNRLAFKERLEHALMLAGNDRRGLALFYLDLDRFKAVNDERGHKAGDVLLVEAARRMQAAVRSVDTVARIGGDEFTIILPYLDDDVSARRLAERIIESLNRPFVIDGVPARVGASIGIAFFPQHGLKPDALMARADDALYAAKGAGRNTFRFAKGETAPDAAADAPPIMAAE
jgi:diguanylate cyclase (GGDEF)-like protein